MMRWARVELPWRKTPDGDPLILAVPLDDGYDIFDASERLGDAIAREAEVAGHPLTVDEVGQIIKTISIDVAEGPATEP